MALFALDHKPTRADFRALLRLAAPLVSIQVGTMLMGVVDTVMVGHVSPSALASVALGHMYFFAFSIFGMGVLFALDPIVAQALGARDELAVRRGLQRGLVLSLLLTVPISLVLLTVRPVLELAGQPIAVISDAAGFVHRNALSVWPFYVFIVLRQTLQAHHRVLPIFITIVVANLVNIGLNYLWIYGHFGFPAMGVLGSAWATTVSRWLMAALMLVLGWPTLKPYLREVAPNLFDLRPLLRMLKIGWPIGAQMMLEGGAFNVLFRFVLIPMTLFSGSFFPITEIPLAFRWLAWISPLWHGNELARGAALNSLQLWPAIGHLVYLSVLLVVGLLVARRCYRTRLIV